MNMTRSEAIQCIKHELLITVNRKDLTGQAIGEALDMAIEALKAYRPQGEWIYSHEITIAEGLYCSNCGKHGYGEKDCPSCGAKMKGINDE